jgi:hypothetical protein
MQKCPIGGRAQSPGSVDRGGDIVEGAHRLERPLDQLRCVGRRLESLEIPATAAGDCSPPVRCGPMLIQALEGAQSSGAVDRGEDIVGGTSAGKAFGSIEACWPQAGVFEGDWRNRPHLVSRSPGQRN